MAGSKIFKLLTRAQPDLFWNQGSPFLHVPERLDACNPEENYDEDYKTGEQRQPEYI
jgi:hypothetical protein